MDPSLHPIWWFVGLAAGAVSGGTGFGAGLVFVLLALSGHSLLGCLALVKCQAAACDLAACLALSRAGQLRPAVSSRPGALGAVGAALGALALVSESAFALFAVITLALGGFAVARGQRQAVATDAGHFALGAYLAVWGFGVGAAFTAHRMARGGASFARAVAEARVFGAAGNLATLAVLAVLGLGATQPWDLALPLVVGPLIGTYLGARVLARVGGPSGSASGGQSVPSRCMSEQVSQRLPPRPSTCE